jgi:predicted TIM-barrel fold metal-dependent hydrolase
MIIDADTHYAPHDMILKISDIDYIGKCLDNNRAANRNEAWQDFYQKIKEPSWPECNNYQDFAQLPLVIRKEIAEVHFSNHVIVSNDLSQAIVDGFSDDAPYFADFVNGLEYFVKVDRALINPQASTMLMQYGTDTPLAVEIMQAWNREMTSLCQQNNRVDANAWLALQDFEASMSELEFIASQDFFGIYMSDRVPWGLMPKFQPLFEACENYKIPIYFHFSVFEDIPLKWNWDRNNLYYEALKNKWKSFEHGWYIGIASMIVGGLLDSYPNLKIVVAERGIEWMPKLREFMLSQGWKDPLPYYKKNFWTTFEIEMPFTEVADLVGWDRLLFSSDYPHNDPGGRNRFSDVDMLKSYVDNGKISQEIFDLITHKNYLTVRSRD